MPAMAEPAIIATSGLSFDETTTSVPSIDDLRDPFYASIFPQCYALAATTVLAYMLLIMLVIAPRSFLDGGVVVLGRRGFTNGPSNGISIGGRPWLQKVAALLVAISLTIASADTFHVAERQYTLGIQNAQQLQEEVMGGTELKVIQLISDTFLWLAQAQTLIRLFPRQREKVIIKWTAFSLISLDVIFGALNSFHYAGPGNTRPRSFTDAVPALSYLFQLSLGLLYAAWVIYYAFMKKRYAFYHPLMKNISLMAALSILSLLVPVVFFVLDIAEPEFTGWGDYVRWVGAAAASVVVWEWVERIEALEREEKKDGVLGREVFDGDEMIDVLPSDLSWPRRRKTKKKDEDNDGGESGTSTSGRSNMWPAMSSIASRYRSRSNSNSDQRQQQQHNVQNSTTTRATARFLQPPLWPSRPPPAVTPISRTDTASADSTVYAVRYQPLTETTTSTTEERYGRPPSRSESTASSPDPAPEIEQSVAASRPKQLSTDGISEEVEKNSTFHRLNSVAHWNPFQRKPHAPPAEVLPHTVPKPERPRRSHDNLGRWDFKGRVEDFAATQAERIMERIRPTPDTESLPVNIIPAPPRRGAALAQVLEEEQLQTVASNTAGSLSPSAPLGRPTRSVSITSWAVPAISSSQNSGDGEASNHLGTSRNPTERNGSMNLHSGSRHESALPAATSSRSKDLRQRSGSERRPIDDILQRDPASPS
ncbi:pH-response regulator protein palH/rim-21 [Xylariaceae sp. FL0016]|nr:pH-response regulator protein palH/rim-21 [Xylariaceae sp. FL0016]